MVGDDGGEVADLTSFCLLVRGYLGLFTHSQPRYLTVVSFKGKRCNKMRNSKGHPFNFRKLGAIHEIRSHLRRSSKSHPYYFRF